MSDWDRETLRQHVDELAAQDAGRSRSIEFEALSSEVVLSDRGLTVEEINAGIIGGSRDGALDAVYVFVNGLLVREDSDYLKDKPAAARQLRNPVIRVELVQAKESNGFSDNAIVLASAGASDLLNVDRDEAALAGQYSEEVIEATGAFVKVSAALRLTHPVIQIVFTYASVADESSVHPNVKTALRNFEAGLGTRVYGAQVSAHTLGVESFVGYLRKRPSYNGLLIADELTPHQRPGAEASWLALVSLKNYIAFLTEPDDDSYRDYLFTDNVRDFNPAAPVNRDIAKTLHDADSPEFWWLNNGVTIVCTKVTAPGKSLAIEDIQIVNGLQTSQSIWEALHDAREDNPLMEHCVLVRVIPTPDKRIRNMVIRATNSQTPVKDEGLRATSDVQLDIEEILLEANYYYDRRRNYYRNQGKPRARIVGIRRLAQCLLTWTKFRPDDARARPNDYLASDSRHDQLFSRTLPKGIFAWILDAQLLVEDYLAGQPGLDAAERNDMRFLMGSLIAKTALGTRNKPADHLLALGSPSAVVTNRRLATAFKKATAALAEAQSKDKKVRRDQLVKNRGFVDSLVSDRTT